MLDSGVWVIQVLLYIYKKGVYRSAPIKKRRYWPCYIDGKKIIFLLFRKYVGCVDALCSDIKNMPLCAFVTKEEDYIIIIMSIYSTN